MHWMTWLKTTTKSIGPVTLIITLHILRSLATMKAFQNLKIEKKDNWRNRNPAYTLENNDSTDQFLSLIIKR
jgi:hypothetical protein